MSKESHSYPAGYSQETLDLLHQFQAMYLSYLNTTKIDWRNDNTQRTAVIQDAWNQFIRSRKQDTGSGFYIPQSGDNGNHR